MYNRMMAEKLRDNTAEDVSACERTAAGHYVLKAFDEDGNTDYCNSTTEAWMWSIGRLKEALTIEMADGTRREFPAGNCFASSTDWFYSASMDSAYECVWLR